MRTPDQVIMVTTMENKLDINYCCVFFANLRYPMIYIRSGLIVVLVLELLIGFQMIVAIGFMASSMYSPHFLHYSGFFLMQ
jgi:hypothetical protein